MHSHRFSVSGALAKQRVQMIEKMSMGQVREVEQTILDSVTFSPALKGTGQVQLDIALGLFNASYKTGNGEMMVKQVDNLKVANEWLLLMLETYKSGVLAAHIRAATKDGKPAAQLESATDALLAKSSADGLADLLSKPESEAKPEDVTSAFLTPAKAAKIELPMSSICVHKGSQNTYMAQAARDQSLFGVMLGKEAWNQKFHVASILLSSTATIDEILQNQRVQGRCTALGLIPCGAIVSGSRSQWMQENQGILEKFKGNCANPLVVCGDFSESISGAVHAWEFNHEKGEVVEVAISHTTNPRDVSQRLVYNITHVDDFGISHLENATKKICNAVITHALSNGSLSSDSSPKPSVWNHYRKLDVPADGLCGFHSLLAANDLERFEMIPRKANGYAKNTQMLDTESNNAKQFHKDVCEKALEMCPEFRSDILRVQTNPSFSPADLSWISKACGIAVRLTCSPEAGMRSFKKNVLIWMVKVHTAHCILYIYICIYLYACIFIIYI